MLLCKKNKISVPLPINWPSPLHNKCDNKKCRFPNDPQPVEGLYDCKGIPGGFFCDGHYYISHQRAHETDKFFKEQFRLEAETEKRAASKKKKEKEQALQEALKYQQEEQARQCAAAELQARFEAERQRGRCKSPDQFYQNQPLERRTAQRSRQRGEQVTPPRVLPNHPQRTQPHTAATSDSEPRMMLAAPKSGHLRAPPRHPTECLSSRPIVGPCQGPHPRQTGLNPSPPNYPTRNVSPAPAPAPCLSFPYKPTCRPRPVGVTR
ncbi:hypothetical protein BD779DRAFT_566044 [Infundibulicybe gibba]|nr:hypothetical protein BD779DRAFT_566044 [Infundibulicybe gibba]